MALEYWLKGDIPPGPVKATVVTDVNRVVEIIRKYLGQEAILVGANIKEIEAAGNINVIDHIIEMAKALNAPVIVSSSDVVKRIDEKGFKGYKILFPLEAIQKISKGLVPCKLAIFIGFRYAYEWLLLNYLKHYRPDVQSLSLDPYAQPNATWTLPSLPLVVWYKNFTHIVESLKTFNQK
ncbi:carbon monoxide dehydrogenase beta subunit family protein [Ignisphaera sp. 4213-co]|uniref:Carbon monoxide dehydrogenase beta subunit family protein n=1 Tax=Ignisphaera cupida TaxID=3050454 RepID=A0ABD4Z6H0_9CREN|nr:carbon monoxide dehydrogenase beta subunit family protein [Ignisphaera sp. 4213-co]MDK6028775.1 carbon monoxide dehydrogenase beta subunit family protein [Ignisphaera sp. 4213-co]